MLVRLTWRRAFHRRIAVLAEGVSVAQGVATLGTRILVVGLANPAAALKVSCSSSMVKWRCRWMFSLRWKSRLASCLMCGDARTSATGYRGREQRRTAGLIFCLKRLTFTFHAARP